MRKEVDGLPQERKLKTPEQALSSLMRYCARAERSSGDALRLMRNWGIAERDAQNILDRLLREKFIDDRRFAEAYVRDKSRLSGWGPYKIRAGLKGKGIAGDTINGVLAELDRGESADRLRAALGKKLAGMTGTAYEKKGKLVRFGLSRGFDYDTVINVCDQLLKDYE